MASLDWTSWSFLPSADVAMCRRGGGMSQCLLRRNVRRVKLLSGGLPHASASVGAEKERKKIPSIHPSVSWKISTFFLVIDITRKSRKKKNKITAGGTFSLLFFFFFFDNWWDALPPLWWRVIYYFRSICDSSALASLLVYVFNNRRTESPGKNCLNLACVKVTFLLKYFSLKYRMGLIK